MVTYIVCVAIYGFHIAIVAALLMLVGTRSVWVAIGGIALYILLVGADNADHRRTLAPALPVQV